MKYPFSLIILIKVIMHELVAEIQDKKIMLEA
jgi:hypothetical protein